MRELSRPALCHTATHNRVFGTALQALLMHYLRRQCVIQWPTIEHTIFNSNYPPSPHFPGERQRWRARERERDVSFGSRGGAFYCTAPQTCHLHLHPTTPIWWSADNISAVLECGWWQLSFVFSSSSFVVQLETSVMRTHTHTHTEQITEPFMSQYSCSLLAGSTLRASHTSSLGLATSAYERPSSLPPNMVRKVRLAGAAAAAAANLSGSTSV